MTQSKLHQFDLEIIASIENEKRSFDMTMYLTETTDDNSDVAQCNTASCMAGHIEALRRPMAKRLLKSGKYGDSLYGIDHAQLAAEIYRRVTGEECTLDFLGWNRPKVQTLSDLTRDDAVAHIKDTHEKWPQL